MERAAELNYITVGEKNDPQDWRLHFTRPGTEVEDIRRPRSAKDIIQSVVANRDVGGVVLLHDGGGDRALTIQALPQIITQLRALGYHFASLSEFTGIPRAQLMPPVTSKDILLAGADSYVFEVSYWFQRTLTTLFVLSVWLGVSRVGFLLILALIQRLRERRRVFPVGYAPSVSVVIAAYNEEKVIARTVQALLDSDYANLEIIVVDDGSQDRTSEVVQEAFGHEPRVQWIRKENGGKASALNRGIVAAHGDILVSLDADTLFAPDTISRLVRHFADPKVGAVSGNVQVGNTGNLLTKWQALEYITSQNFDRRAYDLLDCITVVPGAVGALRRVAVMEVGGYTHDTLAEDTDLTWKLHRAGWRIVNDNSAMAYTEAPETLQNLAKQRFRWAFGTLQCLWKHRPALGHHGAFGWLALPSLWLYQILFPAISPFMDVAMVWSLFAGNWAQLGFYYLLMVGIEFVAAAIAIKLGRGNPNLLPWLFFQRFLYRQLMYYVILKSLVAAIRGGAVGWNKFERTGTARIAEKVA
jgi:poly-beta-1,6 N-acetyl-D-glucosamine synthase